MTLKLIEVALPLKAINEATATEKRTTARLAHPAKIHQWWARRPLTASRAVLFAQLVDDPSAHPELFTTPDEITLERNRLFEILEGLLDINGPSIESLKAAHAEIIKCVGTNVTVLDPFAGGGSIPMEAQRLGLNVEASDLNPIPILLNHLMLDMVRCSMDKAHVHPSQESLLGRPDGRKLDGLASDIVWYGERLNELVTEQNKLYYPTVFNSGGKEYPIIAWIWCRQVRCPNPGCKADVPLVTNLWLSKKKDRGSWLEPRVDKLTKKVSFDICTGKSGPIGKPSKSGRGPRFICYVCDNALPETYTHDSVDTANVSLRLLAVATKGDKQRVYFSGDDVDEEITHHSTPAELDAECRGTFASNAQGRRYGFKTFADYFTPRQLRILTSFSSNLNNVRDQVLADSKDDVEYSNLVTTVLAICLSKLTDTSNALSRWLVKDEVPVGLFARQAVSMVWDFPEANVLGDSSGSWRMTVSNVARSISGPLSTYQRLGESSVSQANAATREYPENVIICTDPPYFNNIGYADLSDFFYVWLRLSLQDIYPELFRTLLTPKIEELVATPHRFNGSQTAANEHFENGFKEVFSKISQHHHPEIPMTVFYAYKQEDDEGDDSEGSSGAGATGWEKLLQGMVDTGLQVTATWPIRTEMGNRMIGIGTNSLASSVVLVCRPRATDAGLTDRQGFLRHLRQVLGKKIIELHTGGVLPVDMAQASIGPGMSVFTSYSRVLDSADKTMTVGIALQLINQVLDELQSENESDLDADTRWAVSWFEQNGMNAGPFGDAQNLATARSIAMNAIERSGIIESRSGNVRLLDRSEYPDNWDPKSDKRITVWEVCQHLIRRLDGDGGAIAAASILRQVGGLGDAARDLSYRLYEIANRNGWADEARAYNNLAAEWPDLVALAAQTPQDPTTLF